jgi:dephospho-CoA kinase
MLLVGITGGIGSGKSTVCKIFEVLGVPVYYADDRAKHLMHHDLKLKQALENAFGSDIYKDGKLDRALLASRVFSDKDELAKLNALVHPAVGQDSIDWQLANSLSPYTLREAALLFETGIYKSLNKVIVVTAPLDVRIARVMGRDKVTEEQVKDRIANQWSEEQKVELADFIVINDGKQELISQVLEIHRQLLEIAKGEV